MEHDETMFACGGGEHLACDAMGYRAAAQQFVSGNPLDVYLWYSGYVI
jgi:hypothetical protein